MASELYNQLSSEGKTLVQQAMERLDPLYDPQRGMVTVLVLPCITHLA